MDVSESVDGVPIRLTAERWVHIVENHDEVAGYYEEVLETVADPEVVLAYVCWFFPDPAAPGSVNP